MGSCVAKCRTPTCSNPFNCSGGCRKAPEVHDDRDDELTRELYLEELRMLYHFKLLVLGAGESGKSTVVKQLRFIHKLGTISEREQKRIKETLVENTLDCFKSMLEACVSNNIELDDEEDSKLAELLLDEEEEDNIVFDGQMAEQLIKLWNSEAIKNVYNLRDSYWLLDSCDYYMENINRFADPTFEPVEDDVVMARVRTTGIVTTEFNQRNGDATEEWDQHIHFQVIDVGGQRAERKKWMHCFDDVRAICFVVNLAGYNMVLFEDDTVNRMHEALELFEETVTKPIFRNTPIFVLLNKKDLFEAKIKKNNIDVCFDDYKGDQDMREALEFISERFRSKMPPENQDRFRVFFVASRVKKDIRDCFYDLQADLIKMNKTHIEAETKRIKKAGHL